MRYALLTATFFLAFTCLAQDNTQPAWSGAYSADLRTRYFGPTVSKVFADQGVVQQELDVTRQLGDTAITGSVWNSTGATRWFQDFAYETDFGVTASHKVKKFVVSATAGIFLLYPKAGFDVWQLDFKASRTFVSNDNAFTPFAEFQNRAITNNASFHGSQYPMAGMVYQRKLNRRFSFRTMFRENYDIRGGFGNPKDTSLFYAQAGIQIKAGESLTVILPRVEYGGSYHDPGRPGRFTWSTGIAKTF